MIFITECPGAGFGLGPSPFAGLSSDRSTNNPRRIILARCPTSGGEDKGKDTGQDTDIGERRLKDIDEWRRKIKYRIFAKKLKREWKCYFSNYSKYNLSRCEFR